MAVPQTKAASFIQEHTEEISSHQIISLLMDGALERIDQAKAAYESENREELEILLQKLIAIINGLRNSLDLEKGGEIAENLDSLYEYMVISITNSEYEALPKVLQETSKLVAEIKDGWDKMDLGSISPALSA